MDTTTNYGLKKPSYEDGADIEVLNENSDVVDAALTGKAGKDEIPAKLPNPAALMVNQGPGGQTGTYDGSTAMTISVPKINVNPSAPSGSDWTLWGVY